MPSNPPPRWPAYRFVGWFTADSPEPQLTPKPHHDGASGRIETIAPDKRQVTVHVVVPGSDMRNAANLSAYLEARKTDMLASFAPHVAKRHPRPTGKVAAKK